ncbi:MAG: amino acid permease [Desulfobacterales bacterium]|nr:amino acid permease [Desulfobacterales bacterium]
MKNSLNGDGLKREIGLFTATVLLIANMVGTGIFATSGYIMTELGHPLTLLLCWLFGGLFALCGALCYGELGARFPRAGGEIKNPQKNIRVSLAVGTLAVMGLYLLINAVYIYAMPAAEMRDVLDIGAKAAVNLFGDQISRYFSAAVSLGILSVLSAMIMTGPRVYYAMSRDGVFFTPFARVNKKRHTPAASIFLQGAIAVFLVLTSVFNALLIYIGFTLSIFAVLTVIGMIWLRYRRPDQSPAYKTFGYPITPLLFIFGNLWIIIYSVKSRPLSTLFGLATIAEGILLYLYLNKRTMAFNRGENS